MYTDCCVFSLIVYPKVWVAALCSCQKMCAPGSCSCIPILHDEVLCCLPELDVPEGQFSLLQDSVEDQRGKGGTALEPAPEQNI